MPSRWVTGCRWEPEGRPVLLLLRRARRSLRLASAAECTSCCRPAPGMMRGSGLPERPDFLQHQKLFQSCCALKMGSNTSHGCVNEDANDLSCCKCTMYYHTHKDSKNRSSLPR